MSGYLLLVLAAVSYAVGILAQTVAARRTEIRDRVDPGLLVRLAHDRLFLLGFAGQIGGFVLTYFARATLPLYLVQAGAAAAVGLAAVGGVLLLGWRVRAVEVVVLVAMTLGLVLMVSGALPSTAYDMSTSLTLALVGILALTALLAIPAARLRGARGAVALGALAGVAFAVLAVACRPIADDALVDQLLSAPLWIVVVSALVGQALMTAGFQRGSSTATAASMDAVSTVIAALVGLALLGDRIAAGHTATVLAGLVLVVAAVVALAAVAAVAPEAATLPAPRPAPSAAPSPAPPPAPSPAPSPVPAPRAAPPAVSAPTVEELS
jgi:hypothetical protein